MVSSHISTGSTTPDRLEALSPSSPATTTRKPAADEPDLAAEQQHAGPPPPSGSPVAGAPAPPPYFGIVLNLPGSNDFSMAPLLLQIAAVSTYIIADTVLRFLYQDVIAGTDQQNSDKDVLQYDKPMFLSYCSYVCFTFWGWLVLPYVWWYRRETVSEYLQTEWCGALSLRDATCRCVYVVILITYQNYFYMSGLRYVRVAISTAVGQSEAPITVGLTVLALGRRFAYQELRGVVLCLTGIALIVIPPALQAGNNNNNNNNNDDDVVSTTTGSMVHGVIYTVIGALFFSVYQIFWQKFDEERFPSSTTTTSSVSEKLQQHQDDTQSNGNDSQTPIVRRRTSGLLACVMDSFTTIAMVGVCNIGVGLILLLFMHVVGVERLEWPDSTELWRAIATSSFLSAFVDAVAGLACVVASAVVVAMSYPLTIPLSVILEQFWSGIPIGTFGWAGWVGTVLVLAGIFFLETEVEDDILTGCARSPEAAPPQETMCQCDDGTCYILSEDGKVEATKRPWGNDGENDSHSLTGEFMIMGS